MTEDNPEPRAGPGDTDGARSRFEESAPTDLWNRWYGEPDVPFHRYCDFFPWRIDDRGGGDADEGLSAPAIHYLDWLPRDILRYTPMWILIAWLSLAIAAEFSPGVIGVMEYLTFPSPTITLVAVLWVLLLLWLLHKADIMLDWEFIEGMAVYLIGGFLLAGTVFSVVYVTTALRAGVPGDAIVGEFGNVVLGSNLFLMMFIGGHLVYDGMLRTENLFTRLAEKRPPVVVAAGDSARRDDREAVEQAYGRFLGRFEASLKSRVRLDLPGTLVDRSISCGTVYLFTLGFVIPFTVSGLVLSHGSLTAAKQSIHQNPLELMPLLVPTALVLLNVIVFFQFLVLISYFYELLTKHRPASERDVDFTLEYQPRHPDGYAGFRDMGKFATRVNALLIVGGLYVVSRVYIGGLPALQGIDLATLDAAALNWLFNFLGPVAAYVMTVVVWMYFSFWQIHKTMRRGRELSIRSVAAENDGELPDDKLDYKQAPIWPINTRLFASLILGDILPVFTLLPIFQ